MAQQKERALDINDAIKTAEAKREIALEAKEDALQVKNDLDKVKERRNELQRLEKKTSSKRRKL